MYFGLKATAGTALVWAALATAGLAAARATHSIYGPFVATSWAALVAVALTATYRGRTLAGWAAHRRRAARRVPRLAQLISHDGVAILWDHANNLASVLVEVQPRPFALNILDQDGTWSSQGVRLEPILRELRQYDIRLHDIVLVTVGHTYRRHDALARAAFATTGPIPALCKARTHLRVTVDLAAVAHCVAARSADGPDPRERTASGLVRTIQIAASRVERAVSRQGFQAAKLSREEAMDLHRGSVELLTAAVNEEGFRQASAKAPYLVGFTPVEKAPPSTHSDWLRATSEPCASITRMTSAGDRENRVEQMYCNKVDRLDTVALAEAEHLRREYGQHAAIAQLALPLAATPKITATPSRTSRADSPWTGHDQPAPGGVGVYLGQTTTGHRRVWLDISTPDAEPLWLIGPLGMVELLLLRAAPLGLRIDVRGSALAETASALRHESIGPFPNPDVVILAAGDAAPRRQHATAQRQPARIVWSPSHVQPSPKNQLALVDPNVLFVRTPQTETYVRWAASPPEAALLAERTSA